MTEEPSWPIPAPGSVVVLRQTGHHHTPIGSPETHRVGITYAWPYRLIEASPELIALHMPVGTRIPRFDLSDHDHQLDSFVHGSHPSLEFRRGDVLRLKEPGSLHSVWLHWSTGPERAFLGWYVNIEAPWIRTSIGFDTSDLAVDVLIAPDGELTVKDEDQLDDWTAVGVFTPAERIRIKAEVALVIGKVRAAAWPFDGAWSTWRPESESMPLPVAPDGWERIPGVDYAHFINRPLRGLDPSFTER